MHSSQHTVYTAILLTFPFGIVVVMILQTLSFRYSVHKVRDRFTKILLYCVYVSALLCGLFGVSLHTSRDAPMWCKFYGFTPCFTAFGAAKAFLLGFFLRRARKANVVNINANKSTRLFYDRIAPIYIFIYWLTYCAIAAAVFSGTYVDPEKNNDHNIISYCLFDSWALWFIITAGVVDIFNCVSALVLFLTPLLRTINHLSQETKSRNVRLLSKFVSAMKWNTALSFVATLSSVMALVAVPLTNEYIWLWCIGDPFLNSVCAFVMMASNRRYIVYIVDKCCNMCSVTRTSIPVSATSFSEFKLDFVDPECRRNVTQFHTSTDLFRSQSIPVPMVNQPKLKLNKTNSC